MDYYQHDLALVHARGFSRYADRCAPAVLDLLALSSTCTCSSTPL